MLWSSTCKGQHRATPGQLDLLYWPCVFLTLYGNVHYGYSVPSRVYHFGTLQYFMSKSDVFWHGYKIAKLSISRKRFQATILLFLLMQSANQSRKHNYTLCPSCSIFKIFPDVILAPNTITWPINLAVKCLIFFEYITSIRLLDAFNVVGCYSNCSSFALCVIKSCTHYIQLKDFLRITKWLIEEFLCQSFGT